MTAASGTRPGRPEVLAPAGDEACLRAAVAAGADAVYFGLGGTFNARARATGFDEAGLERALRYLHAHGRRGHVTMNTLVFDDEIPALERALRAVANAGADAILVQDLGVLRLARELAPTLPIHASTQMTCTDAGSVRFAASLGAERVVLARELSLDQIRTITAAVPGVEIEVFVHGALCIAYSGQCLTSEAIGGRSANRGACAQACRLPYELIVDGVLRELGDRAYLLSPEDLESSALVPDLAAAGVRSLKIEGRLKSPEYVAATTRLYRAAVDALDRGGISAPRLDVAPQAPSTAAVERALQTFSRGSGPGFLEGIDHQRLVDGRGCDHRGVEIGRARGTRESGRRTLIDLEATTAVARGDGILVEGGHAGRGEVGGRIWAIETREPGAGGRDLGGQDVERADPGSVTVWLGPDTAVPAIRDGARVFRTNAPQIDGALRAEIERGPAPTPIDVRLAGELGVPALLTAATRDGRAAEVALDLPTERARVRATDPAAIRDAIGGLGGTPFSLGTLELSLPDGAMLPLSALKRARRALADSLAAAAHRAHGVADAGVPGGAGNAASFSASLESEPNGHTRRAPKPLPPGVFVLCRTAEQARAALDAGAAGVYLDFLALTGAGATLRALRAARPDAWIGLAPPRIRKPGEERIDRYLLEQAPDAILVRSLGALGDASERTDTIARVGDFSLNAASTATAREVLHRLDAFTPSFDLDARQLAALGVSLGPLAARMEVVVHHPMPLFHMEHCVFAALLSDGKDHRTCGRPCERHALALRDRAGMDHPVEADVGCRNTVFHARAQSAASLLTSLAATGVRRFRIELVRETAADVARIVAGYEALLTGRTTPKALYAELRTAEGVGVVRGSLRVLP